MKIIITEQQNEQLNHKVRLVVKQLGLEQSRQMFGDELIKQAFIDNPLSFLDQFNDLRRIEKYDKVYYVDNDNLTLFFYYKKDLESKYGIYWISYTRIWAFFEEVMGYNPIKIKGVMKEWLDTIYKLTELKPRGKSYIDFDPGWEQPII